MSNPRSLANLRPFTPATAPRHGRKPGVRDKLAREFLNDVLYAWRATGREALAYLAESDPTLLVQVTAAVVARLDAGPRASPATLDRIAEALERLAALAEDRDHRVTTEPEAAPGPALPADRFDVNEASVIAAKRVLRKAAPPCA